MSGALLLMRIDQVASLAQDHDRAQDSAKKEKKANVSEAGLLRGSLSYERRSGENSGKYKKPGGGEIEQETDAGPAKKGFFSSARF